MKGERILQYITLSGQAMSDQNTKYYLIIEGNSKLFMWQMLWDKNLSRALGQTISPAGRDHDN